MTIQWTNSSAQQLAAAHAYAAQNNVSAADRLVLRIVTAVKNLSLYPRSGRPGRVSNTRELVIVNTPFMVAYRLKDENTIQILAVLHSKRRWPAKF